LLLRNAAHLPLTVEPDVQGDGIVERRRARGPEEGKQDKGKRHALQLVSPDYPASNIS
jgi:hypothetical protein